MQVRAGTIIIAVLVVFGVYVISQALSSHETTSLELSRQQTVQQQIAANQQSQALQLQAAQAASVTNYMALIATMVIGIIFVLLFAGVMMWGIDRVDAMRQARQQQAVLTYMEQVRQLSGESTVIQQLPSPRVTVYAERNERNA